MSDVLPANDAHGTHYLLRPKSSTASSGIGVIWAPGGATSAYNVLSRNTASAETNMIRLFGEIFTTHIGDLSGNHFGTSVGIAAMDQAHADLIATGCNQKVAIVGVSLGHILAASWAAANPSKTKCVIGIVPVSNLQGLRDENPSGIFRPAIDGAWGVTYPDPLPVGNGASDTAHAETLDKASVLATNNIPWRGWAGDADTIININHVRSFASNYSNSSALTEVPGGQHDDSTVGTIDTDELISWIWSQ